jgi:nucleotide-binding universal stress UspA family protein
VAKVPILPGQPIFNNHVEVAWHPDPQDRMNGYTQMVNIKKMIILLDGSENAAQAIPLASLLAGQLKAEITLLSAVKVRSRASVDQEKEAIQDRLTYLETCITQITNAGIKAQADARVGSVFSLSEELTKENGFGLVVTSTRGASGELNWLRGGLSHKLVKRLDTPVLLVPVDSTCARTRRIDRILVALDGSIYSQRALPYARLLAKAFSSRLVLLCVSEIPEARDYRAPDEVVVKIRRKAETNMFKFLNNIARMLRRDGLKVDVRVTGSIPAHAILDVARQENVNMLVMTSQGRGGYDELLIGSVAEYVVQNTTCPVFMVPIQRNGKDTLNSNPG